ncbi:MAG: hypothetical protein KDA05_01260 [Phycisphaerales bacterium]|nr:hypothetical protein [Phycisphaerales bacterium]
MVSAYGRSRMSLVRVGSLLATYATSGSPWSGDILRSAVVYLHAAIEDYLRGFAFVHWRFEGRHSEVWRRLDLGIVDPTAVDDDPEKPNKPKLKPIALLADQSRDKTVQQVIDASIEAWLESSSITRSSRVYSWLGLCGFAEPWPDGLVAYISKLDSMMLRRHQIVHRGDVKELVSRASGPASPEDIVLDQVVQWWFATSTFVELLHAMAVRRSVGDKGCESELLRCARGVENLEATGWAIAVDGDSVRLSREKTSLTIAFGSRAPMWKKWRPE